MIILKSKHKLHVLGTALLMALHSLNNVFKAIIISQMIDAAVNQSINTFIRSARVGFIGFILFMVIGLLMVKSKALLIKKLNVSIKEMMIEDIIRHSKSSENRSKDLSFMTNDLKQLETKGLEAELAMVQLAFTAFFSLLVSLYYDVWVTVAFVVGTIVPAILSMVFQKKIEISSHKWTRSNATYTNRLKDYFNGLETVRTYQVEDRIIKKATEEAGRMEEALRTMNLTIETLNQYVMMAVNVFSFIMPFGIGVYRIIQSNITLGTFMAIVQLSNTIINPLLEILELVNSYTTTSAIKKRFFKARERIEETPEFIHHQKIPEFSSIKLENLGVKLKDNYLFSDVNLSIQKKNKILVIGPSGSGKSTLLRIVQQTLPMVEGRYLYNGKEWKEGLTQQFSLIRQQPLIFNDSIRYNITLGDEFTEEEVLEAARLAQLEEVILVNGLDYLVGENGQNLSGGQLQRIEIARALIRKRPIILADEMTSALDEKTASAVRETLLELPCTLVEVTHNFTSDEQRKYSQVWDLGQF